jgi:phosphate transport system protein
MEGMTHLETELQLLKTDIIEMWGMVINQMEKSKMALLKFDKDLAHDIRLTEKRIDSFELKIDRDCENILALYAPVAIDLRFVLAILKMNSNLERIGDYANSIAKIIEHLDKPFKPELIRETKVMEMFDLSVAIMGEALCAFEKDDTQLGRALFKRDKEIDEINDIAPAVIRDLIAKHPDYTGHLLELLSIIRRLERAGDHTQNIAEDFIFFIEAKVLKHKSKKKIEGKKEI